MPFCWIHFAIIEMRVRGGILIVHCRSHAVITSREDLFNDRWDAVLHEAGAKNFSSFYLISPTFRIPIASHPSLQRTDKKGGHMCGDEKAVFCWLREQRSTRRNVLWSSAFRSVFHRISSVPAPCTLLVLPSSVHLTFTQINGHFSTNWVRRSVCFCWQILHLALWAQMSTNLKHEFVAFS